MSVAALTFVPHAIYNDSISEQFRPHYYTILYQSPGGLVLALWDLFLVSALLILIGFAQLSTSLLAATATAQNYRLALATARNHFHQIEPFFAITQLQPSQLEKELFPRSPDTQHYTS